MAGIDPAALEAAMDLVGCTPIQLAERLGISAEYMRNIRGGHRNLKRNPKLRKQIAEALGVPVRWIEDHGDKKQVA